MTRPAKRSRPNNEESDVDASEALSHSEKLLKQLATSCSDVSNASVSAEAMNCFLELKTLQSVVLSELEASQLAAHNQRKRIEKENLKLENLAYQQTVSEHSVAQYNKLEWSQLANLCCSEMGIEVPDAEEDLEKALKDFLSSDSKDPNSRNEITSCLNQNLCERKRLQLELQTAKHSVASSKKSLASKRKLLKVLPLKLQDMEKASASLQDFCQTSLNASKKLGSKRQASLELARSLPAPLYTLHHQLQSCLDAMRSAKEGGEEKGLLVLKINDKSTMIVLRIPIPNVGDPSSSKDSCTSIKFEYDSKMDMVIARSNNENGMKELIGELFPGDINHGGMSSYCWCNYLGGLHASPSERNLLEMHLSTKVVVRALIRRVRAMATLNHLRAILSKKESPKRGDSNIAMAAMSKVLSRLSSWTEEDAEDGIKTIVATLAAASNNPIVLQIRVNLRRYPAVPPEFKISRQKDESQLYDEELAEVERRINQEVDKLVPGEDEVSCDWILFHQLVCLAESL